MYCLTHKQLDVKKSTFKSISEWYNFSFWDIVFMISPILPLNTSMTSSRPSIHATTLLTGNQVSDKAISWHHLMRNFEVQEWNVNISSSSQYSTDTATTAVYYVAHRCLRDVIPYPVNLNTYTRHITDDSVRVVQFTFDEVPDVFYRVQIRTSAGPIQNIHGFSTQQVLCDICSVRRGSIVQEVGLVLQRVVVEVWHSVSVEDLVTIPPSVDVALDLDQWKFTI